MNKQFTVYHRSEVPYVDLFFYLRRRMDWQEECKITSKDNLVMAMTSDNKKVKKCCSECIHEKECLKKITPREDEGPELDISPLRRERIQEPREQGTGGGTRQ